MYVIEQSNDRKVTARAYVLRFLLWVYLNVCERVCGQFGCCCICMRGMFGNTCVDVNI
jgi:hypothetical protein